MNAEAIQEITEEPTAEVPVEFKEPAASESNKPLPEQDAVTFYSGDFALVTTSTRVFLEPDENAYIGCFVSEAVVQVESARQDGWCKVRYLFGDDHAEMDGN